MILHSITAAHFGPFSAPTKIVLEPDVTIFTGQNDAGKSCALAAIEMICKRAQGQEQHVNMDRIGQYSGPWNTDPGIQISAEFEVTQPTISHKLVRGGQVGDVVNCMYQLNNPGQGMQIQSIRRGSTNISAQGYTIRAFPNLIQLVPDASIRNEIELTNPTAPESELLKLGFGSPDFVASQLQSLNAHRRGIELSRAEDRLNDRLRKFFPEALSLRFKLVEMSAGNLIGVSLVDRVGGYAPISMRGTGVRRMLTLMALLLKESEARYPTLILLDEPETSLHADAQHQLRRTLESLADSASVQVVYATHSPSMINSSHPQRVRVFSRSINRDFATSQVENLNYGENFQRARISLGLTPADSLLYGLVTILVEGDTEARCLDDLIRRLEVKDVPGFEGMSRILDACHFVCSWGDSVSYYCNLATAQNARPVVFLDGDKSKQAADLRERHPGVPIVTLPDLLEIEDIIPATRYISALSDELRDHGADVTRITSDGYEAWAAGAQLPAQMLFSKRIDRWVRDVTNASYSKPVVMQAAIAATPIDEIRVDLLRPLVKAIQDQFS